MATGTKRMQPQAWEIYLNERRRRSPSPVLSCFQHSHLLVLLQLHLKGKAVQDATSYLKRKKCRATYVWICGLHHHQNCQIAATPRKLALHPLSDHIAHDDFLEEVAADTSSEIITMESSYRDRDVGLSIIAGDVLQTYFIIQKKEEVQHMPDRIIYI